MVKFYDFIPRYKNLFSILAVFDSIYTWAWCFFFLQKQNHAQIQRADLSALNLTLEEKANSLEKDIATSLYRYILTASELEKSYKKAQDAFQKNDDTLSQIEINRILNSNASFAIKQKAQLLMQYLAEPTFDSLKTKLQYADIVKIHICI